MNKSLDQIALDLSSLAEEGKQMDFDLLIAEIIVRSYKLIEESRW